MKRKHYESCEPCALKMGAREPKHGLDGITVSMGRCPYCLLKNVTLIPHCDYDWPKEGRKAVWD